MKQRIQKFSWRIWLALAASLALLCVAITMPARAATPGLQASMQNTDPLKPILVLTNSSGSACQVVTSAFGTVGVTSARQDNKDITGKPLPVASDDAPDAVMATQLKMLQPGEQAQIPLRVSHVGSDYALESITWAPGVGLFGVQYPIQTGKPLEVTATYNASIPVTSGPALCGVATTEAGNNPLMFWLEVGGAVLLVVLLAVLAFWLWRRAKRHHKVVAAVVALMGMALSFGGVAVHAEYNVPPEAQTQFDNCMAIFNAHRDVTGSVLDTLAHAHVGIDPNNTHTNDTARYGPDSFRIYWDPTSIYNYPGHNPGDPPVVSYPCDRLFHEMYHAADMLNNTFSRTMCGGSEIETKEVMATRAQNSLRQALGLPPRTHYGTDPLPTGDCNQPTGQQPCDGGGCAQNNGDPHLVTFDGLHYDFQAVGEFVNARDSAGDFEVQTRQVPWLNSRKVSVNTAAAIKVGSDRVELDLQNSGLKLLVNGKEQSPATTKLKGGGMIVPISPQQVIVRWPDGSSANVRTVGQYGVSVAVDPAQARAGKLEGLFGNFNGDTKDDLKLHGTSTAVKSDFQDLYPKYADSWRVDDKSSLFTYDSGTNTNTYTDRGFPYESVDTTNLPNRAAAEAFCRELGLTDPALQDCITDVSLTGRPEFAQSAVIGQQINTGDAVKTWQVNIGTPGQTGSVTFDGTKGQKVFIDVPHSTLPDQCGILSLDGPGDTFVSGGCIISGNGYIDGSVLPATGTYTVTITPLEGHTGTTTLRLIIDNDQTGSITPDGAAKTAIVSHAGEVARFSFSGKAGQAIFVNVPASTLADQCGILSLEDTDGHFFNGGCIISGTGYINTFHLDHDGTYIIAVDPAERHVGQATLQVIVAQDLTKSLDVDGGSGSLTLAKPGSTATFTYVGIAGQKVYIDATDSTLPDQCGGFYLLAPDGSTIGNSCIVSKKGTMDDRGITMPTTGTYRIIVDPADDHTGSVTMRVHR